MRYHFVFVSLFLSACSAKEPTPLPDAAQSTAQPTPGPDTDQPAPGLGDVDQPAPNQSAFLVWWHTDKGTVTSWVGPQGVEATRAQIAIFADDTLWALEARYAPFTETSCDDFENDRKTQGGKRWLPYLVARGLDGLEANDTIALTSAKSGFFSEDPHDGVFELIGEHWGRTSSVVGSWRGLVLVNDCEGAYSCGAHGNTGCIAAQVKLGPDAPAIELAQVAQELAPAQRELLKTWDREGAADDDVTLNHLGIKSKRGEVVIDYTYVAGVPYVGTDGTWSSYTQSRTHTGAPLESLALGPLPDAVKAVLAQGEIDGEFGWSEVPPAHIEAARRAFDDPSTLPSPAPADEPAPPSDEKTIAIETKRLIEKGRRLTRDKHYTDAITAFDKAIADQPTHARAWAGRAYAKLLGGDLSGAKTDCEHALSLEGAPKFQSSVFFNLGEIAEKQGDKALARTHYEKANTLSPSAAAQKRLDALDL